MGEVYAFSHTNDPSWSDEEPKEMVDLPDPSASTTNLAAEQTTSRPHDSTRPPRTLPFHSSYLREILPNIHIAVQLLNWTMERNTVNLLKSVSMAQEQVIRLSTTANN